MLVAKKLKGESRAQARNLGCSKYSQPLFPLTEERVVDPPEAENDRVS
jgi:hypothetical protein